MKKQKKRMTKATQKIVLIDVALLAELASGAASMVILIQASDSVIQQRKKEKLLKRRDFQTPVAGADFTVINNGTLEELYAKADEIWEKITRQSTQGASTQ